MTATNHVLSGAVIAGVISNPILALLLALLSHLALDSLPHFGKAAQLNSRKFAVILFSDMTLAGLFLLYILLSQPEGWLLVISCSIIAASPDLMSIPRWLAAIRKQKYIQGKLTAFLSRIQWGERSWGLIIEVPFAFAMLVVLAKLNII